MFGECILFLVHITIFVFNGVSSPFLTLFAFSRCLFGPLTAKDGSTISAVYVFTEHTTSSVINLCTSCTLIINVDRSDKTCGISQVRLSTRPSICCLKVLPSFHSSAIWCIMVNDSVWCLPTNVHKEWYVGFYYRNNKESHTFQWQIPSFCNMM